MTLSTQFMTMLSMVGMGITFGITLETYNRFLNRTKRKSWFVFINDVLFWILQGLVIFYILFLVNRGELRFYIFIALLCGFAAYQSIFKGIYIRLLEIIIYTVISIYRFLLKMFYYVIFKPIHSLIFLLIYLLKIVGKGLFSLFKILLKTVLWIVKLVLLPVKWIAIIIWKILPNNLKKTVEKLYNRIAGILSHIKKYIYQLAKRWKRDKK